uniref:Zinc finger MYM-type protein 1 n=1 Tax=Neogobius melanostomus TaxID=47308 RepID=A0A8C6WJK3_9GOBI
MIQKYRETNHTQGHHQHENSDVHRQCILIWINRKSEKGQVDFGLRQQFEIESQYWTKVLNRVVATVKFISERGLAFRGDTERFGSPSNGNYLGCLELISEFDPFLKEHIARFGNAGSGNPSYLSSKTCDEFVQLMGEQVLSEIINRIKIAKYFSISVDSTPDLSHTDQLTFIMRYVSPTGSIEERFVTFLPLTSHTGESIANSILLVLSDLGIDISNCRGQCYDNASNMSGSYKGVQSRIRSINPLAEWVPCAAHTLNLVGVNTVNCRLQTEEFFTFVQTLFNFCSSSTKRWQFVLSSMDANESKRIQTLKTLSGTRWCAHAQATNALCLNYDNIHNALLKIAEDVNQNMSTRNEAQVLYRQMEKMETAFLCSLWNTILLRIQRTNTKLQEADLDLSTAVDMVASLRHFIAGLRDEFDRFESTAKELSPSVSDTYKADKDRLRRRKKRPDETPGEDVTIAMTGRQKFAVNVFNVVIDKLVAELDWRYEAYNALKHSFGFLNKIHLLTSQELRSAAALLQKKYPSDIQEDFADEIVQFKEFIMNKDCTSSVKDMLQLMKETDLSSVFPNMDIAFRVYLTLPVSNCSGERSFSKLGLIKNKLRSSIGQEKLNHLTIMCKMSLMHFYIRYFISKLLFNSCKNSY